MILIEGIKIEAFSPRMAYVNHTSPDDEKYSYLNRAIMRSKVYRDGHNYRIGENIQFRNEFLNYKSNILIICEENEKFKFIVIIKGKIFDVTDDVNNSNVKMLLSTHKFDVIDSYGKRLLINSHSQLVTYINAIVKSREKFKFGIDKYHEYMGLLFDFRTERERNSINCYINDEYNKLLNLTDEFAKEIIDVYNVYRENEELRTINKLIYRPNTNEKTCVIFGLYVAVLRAYILNYDHEDSSMTLEEKIRNKFVKEFNYFVAQNEDILHRYSNLFHLKPVEIEEIKWLLAENEIDGEEWDMEYSELTI